MYTITATKGGFRLKLHKGLISKMNDIKGAMEVLQALVPESKDVEEAIDRFIEKHVTPEEKAEPIAAADPGNGSSPRKPG